MDRNVTDLSEPGRDTARPDAIGKASPIAGEDDRAGRPRHVMAAPLLCFGLEEQVGRLRTEPVPSSGHRNAITLVKNGPLRVVLVLLDPGATIDEHTVPGPATVQVIAGRVRFETGAGDRALETGALMAVESGVPHAVTAAEEAVLLLTVVDPRAA